MSNRIPTVKVLENHELRIRKIEQGSSDTTSTTSTTSTTNEQIEPVKKELTGIKQDLHRFVNEFELSKKQLGRVQEIETRLKEMETMMKETETSLAKVRDFAMTTNQDILRFREQIFENKKIVLSIQEDNSDTVSHSTQTDAQDTTQEHSTKKEGKKKGGKQRTIDIE